MAILKTMKSPLSSRQNNCVHQNLRTLFSSNNSKNFDSDDHHHHHHQRAENYHHHHRSYRRKSDLSSNPQSRNTPTVQYNYYYSDPNSTKSSPYYLMPSPFSQQQSPYAKSPWIYSNENDEENRNDLRPKYGLIGSLYREEGHIYSIAASEDYLYTGSDSKNIRVWRNMKDYAGFKSSSGLVKAIVVLGDRIFTGHQDGKIRVWKRIGNNKDPKYTRVGTLPTTRDYLLKSMNPKNYVEARRRRNVPWIKHYDAVSCMCMDQEQGLLYSGSWDKTLKVWRVSDFKCLESIRAHEDAVNSVVIAFGGLVLTGSADGTVKSWRRELEGKHTSHVLVETLLKQYHAITSLAVSCDNDDGSMALYAGSSDGLVNFWEREKQFMSYGGALRGHKLAVLCLAAGGRLVVSGSADKSICVWRRDDGGGSHTCVAVLTGHVGPVKCLTVEEDDEEKAEGSKSWIVYSGSLDKSVKVWRVGENVSRLKEG